MDSWQAFCIAVVAMSILLELTVQYIVAAVFADYLQAISHRQKGNAPSKREGHAQKQFTDI